MSKKNNKVCCPSCGWQPDGGAHWQCLCGHRWDMFSTGARCPACFREWKKTNCIPRLGGCKSRSPHLDWYGDLKAWLRKELSFTQKKERVKKQIRKK